MKMAAFPQQYPNWLEEKIKLENEVNFLKGKLEEGQKVQDAFRMAIERKKKNVINLILISYLF